MPDQEVSSAEAWLQKSNDCVVGGLKTYSEAKERLKKQYMAELLQALKYAGESITTGAAELGTDPYGDSDSIDAALKTAQHALEEFLKLQLS